MITLDALIILVYIALAVTVLTPIILVTLVILDLKGGKLW